VIFAGQADETRQFGVDGGLKTKNKAWGPMRKDVFGFRRVHLTF